MLLSPFVLDALRGALALVAPADCAGCGAPDVELCDRCRARLVARPQKTRLSDGTPMVAALAYEGVVRDVILAFKQSGRFRLARPLGPALGEALAQLASPPGSGGEPGDGAGGEPGGGAGGGPRGEPGSAVLPIAVLAVPASRAGRRRRGYEPVDLLLRAAEAVAAKPRLVILRSTGSQKSRGRAERLRARSGTLRCPAYWCGRRVVIVDDVCTSGATLVEAVRAARAAGALVVGAVCLAATPLISAKAP